jgi:hypothetical protein
MCGLIAAATPSWGGSLTISFDTIQPNGLNLYYVDVLLANSSTAAVSIAATSFGVETSNPIDPNITFTSATSDPLNYIFSGYSGDFAISSTTDITSSVTSPPGSQVIAGDFFFDPSSLLSDVTLGVSDPPVTLGRVFFSDTALPSLTDLALITDVNTTNLSDSSLTTITGSITGPAGGPYSVTVLDVAAPEPATVFMAAQAALAACGLAYWRLRRG